MSKNTVKAGLTRKRAKRQVENPAYGQFVGRILRSYGSRVASGDIEALGALVSVRAEVEATVLLAVTGLKKAGYSWQEIADRLGVSKQAAQMRYGTREDRSGTSRHAIDRRLLDAGLSVSVSTLVEVFIDHYPGDPAAASCPSCGFTYPENTRVFDCPTNATVRPLLVRRRQEDWRSFNRLTPDQRENLVGSQAKRQTRQGKRVDASARTSLVTESLFSTTSLTPRPGLR